MFGTLDVLLDVRQNAEKLKKHDDWNNVNFKTRQSSSSLLLLYCAQSSTITLSYRYVHTP